MWNELDRLIVRARVILEAVVKNLWLNVPCSTGLSQREEHLFWNVKNQGWNRLNSSEFLIVLYFIGLLKKRKSNFF